jgi:hypothetical protein
MTWTTLPMRCAVAVCAIPIRRLSGLHYVAAAPETTSMISRVIAACRTLFM